MLLFFFSELPRRAVGPIQGSREQRVDAALDILDEDVVQWSRARRTGGLTLPVPTSGRVRRPVLVLVVTSAHQCLLMSTRGRRGWRVPLMVNRLVVRVLLLLIVR